MSCNVKTSWFYYPHSHANSIKQWYQRVIGNHSHAILENRFQITEDLKTEHFDEKVT